MEFRQETANFHTTGLSKWICLNLDAELIYLDWCSLYSFGLCLLAWFEFSSILKLNSFLIFLIYKCNKVQFSCLFGKWPASTLTFQGAWMCFPTLTNTVFYFPKTRNEPKAFKHFPTRGKNSFVLEIRNFKELCKKLPKSSWFSTSCTQWVFNKFCWLMMQIWLWVIALSIN